MNIQKILNIIQTNVCADNEEVNIVQKIVDQYPYSQILHTLIAKHHYDTKSAETKTYLQRAAIYATDRMVLKKIIESTPTPPPPPSAAPQETSTPTPHTASPDIEQLRKDIFIHLEELQESKKSFDFENDNYTIEKVEVLPKVKKKSKPKVASPKKKKSKPKVSTSKKEVIQLSQKEQIALIEKFIQLSPIITKNRIKSILDEQQEDLSINDVKIEESFASENLAQILIKQGNKEKAIDVYKKLIWKSPQKKAYFATQIEKLKNNKAI